MKIEFEKVSEWQVKATLTLKRSPGEVVRSYGVIAEDEATSKHKLLAWMETEGKKSEDFE